MIKIKYTYYFKSILIILTLLLITNKVSAQKYSEYDVKAAYVYNFAKFVDWPSGYIEKKETIIIGVYKNKGFGEILERVLENKKIKDKFWEIRFFNTIEDIEDIEECDILFISGTSKQEILQIIKKTAKSYTLTIGNNISKFCQYGGMINFTQKGAKKRFEINNNAAIKHKLKISSKLLILARVISEDEVEF